MDAWTLREHCPGDDGSAYVGVTPGSQIAFPEGAANPHCSWTVMQCFLVSMTQSAKHKEEETSFCLTGSKAWTAGKYQGFIDTNSICVALLRQG